MPRPGGLCPPHTESGTESCGRSGIGPGSPGKMWYQHPLTAHRFFGTKWTMFLGVGIYALFVSTNYWERYYTLVPSAVALGMAIVPLWASMGNYITRWVWGAAAWGAGDLGLAPSALGASGSPAMRCRAGQPVALGTGSRGVWQRLDSGAFSPLWSRMAQKYYEYSHYKERDGQDPQQRPPRGSHAPYLLVFQAIFYSFFHVSAMCGALGPQYIT